MKIEDLEIRNIRGIKELKVKPDGKNILIVGPNGSGKSSVVDAIDFLLTGRIQRLTGKGTGHISLDRHGPHIDCSSEDAFVRATIRINSKKPISTEISRCIAKPNELICDPSVRPMLDPIIQLATRGHHVLTRKEILRFITAEDAERAEEIQALLNLSGVEDTRKTLVKVRNDYEKDVKSAKQVVNSAKSQVTVTAQISASAFNETRILAAINKNRNILGGEPINELDHRLLKQGVVAPTFPMLQPSINSTLVKRDIENIRRLTSQENARLVKRFIDELWEALQSLHSDARLLRALKSKNLIDLGIDLLTDDGTCPLRDTPWAPGELSNHLQQKRSMASVADRYQGEISGLAERVSGIFHETVASIVKILEATVLMDEFRAETRMLRKWKDDLESTLAILSNPIESYSSSKNQYGSFQNLLSKDFLDEFLQSAELKLAEKFPLVISSEQTAWDTLTRFEENLKALQKAQKVYDETELSFTRAALLLDSFQQARDHILGALYDSVRDRFVEFYRMVHELDEQGFKAQLKPEGAGLVFEVDFLGKGNQPPNALHSEGHQDSMGLCLYLALVERLAYEVIDFVILDDVDMSVDSDHRRQLCKVLCTHFPQRQFILTTHDKTWASQLRTEGFVSGKQVIEFYNWSLLTGPRVNNETEIWPLIENELRKNEVPSAAARLRRGSEEFFSKVCDSLHAPARFRQDARWELGEFMPAAFSQYKTLLKKAKSAAKSWGNVELTKDFEELDSIASQIYNRTDCRTMGN
jgi:DNA repair exonuclease SbcCD ATPase subunit